MRFQRKSFSYCDSSCRIVVINLLYKDNKVTLPQRMWKQCYRSSFFKVTAGPSVDGAVDAIWDQATKLEIIPTVPFDRYNNLLIGYIGEQHPVTLRSFVWWAIHILSGWICWRIKSVNVSPWYFNVDSNRWYQEPSAPEPSMNGILTRCIGWR